MKLIELVKYFRDGGSYEKFCQSHSLNKESEIVEVYMEKPFNLSNDLSFFEIEETAGHVEYVVNGVKYFNLFDFYYFLDAIEESRNIENKSLTDAEVAKKLFSYAINDA